MYEQIEHNLTHIKDIVEINNKSNDFSELENLIRNPDCGRLIILGSRPAMGKTALALNIAQDAALKANTPVAIFSLELSKSQLVQRLLCSAAEVETQCIKTGNIRSQGWEKLASAMTSYADAPIYIYDRAGCTVTDLSIQCRELIKKEKNLGLIIVDYLQLIDTEENKGLGHHFADIMRELKRLTKELNIPIVALSQVSRAVERREDKRPILADLQFSCIEECADVVIFIYRDDFYQKDKEYNRIQDAEIIIAKNHYGKTGTIHMQFDCNLGKFRKA